MRFIVLILLLAALAVYGFSCQGAAPEVGSGSAFVGASRIEDGTFSVVSDEVDYDALVMSCWDWLGRTDAVAAEPVVLGSSVLMRFVVDGRLECCVADTGGVEDVSEFQGSLKGIGVVLERRDGQVLLVWDGGNIDVLWEDSDEK